MGTEPGAVTVDNSLDEPNQTREEALIHPSLVERDAIIPNDPDRVYEYAYHVTECDNFRSISEIGLQPSKPEPRPGLRSKEPGTIFFSSWRFDGYPVEKNEVLFRFDIIKMPQVAKDLGYEYEETPGEFGHEKGFRHPSMCTRTPIPSEFLDFSLDGGATWRHASKDIDPKILEQVEKLKTLSPKEEATYRVQRDLRRRVEKWEKLIVEHKVKPNENGQGVIDDGGNFFELSDLTELVEQAGEELEHPKFSVGVRSEDPHDYGYDFMGPQKIEYYGVDGGSYQNHEKILEDLKFRTETGILRENASIIRVPAVLLGLKRPFLATSNELSREPVPAEFIDYSRDGGETWEEVTSLS